VLQSSQAISFIATELKVMFQRSPWSLSTGLMMTLMMETEAISEMFVFSSTLAQLIA
jgi:hypothetical protein